MSSLDSRRGTKEREVVMKRNGEGGTVEASALDGTIPRCSECRIFSHVSNDCAKQHSSSWDPIYPFHANQWHSYLLLAHKTLVVV